MGLISRVSSRTYRWMLVVLLTLLLVGILHWIFFTKNDPDPTLCNNLDCVRCSPLYAHIKRHCEEKYNVKLEKGRISYQPNLPPLSPFPDVSDILDMTTVQELKKALPIFSKDYDRLKRSVEPDDGWKRLFLMNQGNWLGESETRSQLEKILGKNRLMQGDCFGNVLFSTVTENIAEHYGPTNKRLRLQICIETNSGIEIVCGGERRGWKRGELFLLNDWLQHKVVVSQHLEPARTVLIVDIF